MNYFQVQQAREQEMKASEEAVRQLQEEEERLVQTLDFQARQDEELARKIVSEEIPQVRYCLKLQTIFHTFAWVKTQMSSAS